MKKFPDRILTIKEVTEYSYLMIKIGCYWIDDMIECLIEEPKITNRFEILDL